MPYPYRTEPLRPALILIVVVLVIGFFIPVPGMRLIVLLFVSGPIAWAALQWIRRGRGVIVEPEQVVLQGGLLRTQRKVVNEAIQGWLFNGRDQLALAYLQERKADPGEEPRPPRLRLYVTATLDNPVALSAALPTADKLSQSRLRVLLGYRRLRRALYWALGLFVAFPLLVILIIRLLNGVGLLKVL